MNIRLHMFENVGFNTELGKPRQKNFGCHICQTFKEIGFKGGLFLFYFIDWNGCFQLRSKMAVLQCLKLVFLYGVGNKQSYPQNKRDQPWNQAPWKLGRCESRNSLALAYQNPFWNRNVWTCASSPTVTILVVPFCVQISTWLPLAAFMNPSKS